MRKLSPVVILPILVILAGGTVLSCFYLNVANVILYKNLWQKEMPAEKRQAALSLSAMFFEKISEKEKIVQQDDVVDRSYNMIPAILSAEYYRRQENYAHTAMWLHRAAVTAPPYPLMQEAIMLPGWGQLTFDGTIIFDGRRSFWKVRQDTVVKAEVYKTDSATVVLSWHNDAGQRNRGSFSWPYPLYIPYHHTLVLDARIHPECILLFETVVDGERIRHLSHAGTGQWERLAVTVEGDNLRFIYIHIDGKTEQQMRCEAEISALSFLMDENVGYPSD